MPQALTTIDRDLVKTLVLQGLRPGEITRQTGVNPNTLQTWMKRYGWLQLASKSQAIREQALQANSGESTTSAIGQAGECVRNGLGARFKAQVESLQRIGVPASLKSIKKENEHLRALVQNAKDVFGWSDGSASSVINILNLESAKVVEPPAIDVTATPVPPCSS